MVRILREYGLLMLLAVVGAASFFFFRSREDGSLEDALDVVGGQLLSVVDGTEARESVTKLYEQFKARVLEREVTPEQVELLAVSILNLSSSGEKLTAEEAEGVFEIVLGDPATPLEAAEPSPEPSSTSAIAGSGNGDSKAPTDAAVPSAPKGLIVGKATRQSAQPVEPPSTPSAVPGPAEVVLVLPPLPKRAAKADAAQMANLGDRLHILAEFNRVVSRVAHEAESPLDRTQRHVELQTGDGGRLVLSTEFLDRLRREAPREVDRLLKQLESANMVRFRTQAEGIQSAGHSSAVRAEQQARELRRLERSVEAESRRQVGKLAEYRELQAKGVVIPFDLDSLEARIHVSLVEMEAAVAQEEMSLGKVDSE